MIFVQHLFGGVEIYLDAGLLAPGQPQQPVEIIAHHSCFRRHRAHLLEFLELGIGLFTGFLGQLCLGDAAFHLGHLVTTVLAVTKLLLDRLHLLVEIILPLGLLHLPLDAGADALLNLKNRDLAFHEAERLLQPALDRDGREHVLLFRDLDRQVRSDRIGELRVVVDLAGGADHFGRNLLVEFDVVFKLGNHRARQRLDLHRVFLRLGKFDSARFIIVVAIRVLHDLGACASFDKHLDGAVGQLEQLQHIGDCADFINT